MDVYTCGDSPLIQPWTVSPMHVLREQDIQINFTAAENLLMFRSGSQNQQTVQHCRDGYDRTVEETTIPKLRQDLNDIDIQDIWVDTEYKRDLDDDDFADELFGSDYPRGPVAILGLLTSNGAIYRLSQEPYKLQELTTQDIRKPFSHAIIRQECNNGQRDVWPAFCLPSQPDILYHLRTKDELLKWLSGEDVNLSRLSFPSPIVALQSTRGRAQICLALTECGKAYQWIRDDESFLNETLASRLIDLPPVDRVALGLNMGAAILQSGELYVFSLRTSTRGDKTRPHIADLDDGSPQHRVPGPFVPRLASINNTDTKFLGVAAGDDHLVALTSEGKVFTVGAASQGALGIGDKQFELEDVEPRSYEWTHECGAFAEDWQEMVLPEEAQVGQGKGRKVVEVAAGYQSTILILGRAHP